MVWPHISFAKVNQILCHMNVRHNYKAYLRSRHSDAIATPSKMYTHQPVHLMHMYNLIWSSTKTMP